MKYLKVWNENIPLCMLQSFSYSKAANLVDTSRLKVISKGYSCLSLAVSLNVSQYALEHYRQANPKAVAWDYADFVKHFINMNPDVTQDPSNIILAGNVVCPELQFSLVSATHSLQADRNALVQSCEVTWSLAGTRCTKRASEETAVSHDDTIPEVELHVGLKSLKIKEVCSLTQFELTTNTATIQIALSDSFVKKVSNDWVMKPTIDYDSYILIEGYGKYFIRNAEFDDNFVTYSCSIFPKESEQQLSTTVMKSNLGAVLDELFLEVHATRGIRDINVEYFKLNGTSQEILKQLQDGLGFMVGFDTDSRIRIFDIPTNPPEDTPIINFNVTEDTVSAPTRKVIFRNPIKETSYGEYIGDCITVDCPVNTTTDRSRMLLNYYQFMERGFNLTVPYDSRIRHCSYVNLVYEDKIIPAMVTGFSADLLTHQMTLNLNYWSR